MTCYHPLIRYEKFTQYKCQDGHLAYEALVQAVPKDIDPTEYERAEELKNHASGRYRNIQLIPCGHCIGCLLENSRQWATKGCYEAELHKENWFLTITYDDEHLPEADPMIDKETGEEKGSMTHAPCVI